MDSIRIIVTSLICLLQLVVFEVASCAAEPEEVFAAQFLGPISGAKYRYDVGGIVMTMHGMEQVDDNTVRVMESMPVPPQLVAQGFPANNERMYLLRVDGCRMVEIVRERESVLLDVSGSSWTYPVDTIAENGEWTSIKSQCQLHPIEQRHLFGKMRNVATVTCTASKTVVFQRIFASGIGLIESGSLHDDDYLMLQRLQEIEQSEF